jgi:hypothetical protein
MRTEGVEVELFNRHGYGEQEVPDKTLQLAMLNDALANQPGVMVLLTGDGARYYRGRGFCQTLENIHDRLGWSIEVLGWRESCNERTMKWVNANGVFLPLEDFYFSITFLEGDGGGGTGGYRPSREVDFTTREALAAKPKKPNWAL